MESNSKGADIRTAQAAARIERARDEALAMQEYEASKVSLRDKTARLRALRLARESADARAPKSTKPKRKAG